MPTFDEVVDRVRDTAGADFAFALNKRGRLVTRNAPRDMPQTGRDRLVAAARALGIDQDAAEITLPRSELVPYGGAAPVDVYIAVAGDEAILCIVMATWADRRPVAQAIETGLRELEPMVTRKPRRRRRTGSFEVAANGDEPPPSSRSNRKPKTAPTPGAAAAEARRATVARSTKKPTTPPEPPRPSASQFPERSTPSSAPPPSSGSKRAPMAGLVQLSGGKARVPRVLKRPPSIQDAPIDPPPLGFVKPGESMPDIVIGTSPLGRESLEAIELDRLGGPPTGGSATSSAPDIRVELVSMTPELVGDLPREEAKRMQSLANAAVPDPLVGPAAHRLTQPWAEPPVDTKRAIDAARKARNAQPPKVTVKLEEADDDVLEAALVDEPPPEENPEPTRRASARPPKPSLEAWREALTKVTRKPE